MWTSTLFLRALLFITIVQTEQAIGSTAHSWRPMVELLLKCSLDADADVNIV
jgi:hypothetical protein